MNQMWILKNSKDKLEYLQFRSLSFYNSIKTFDFCTLYTTIPHLKLTDRELVQLSFMKKISQRRYKYLVLERDRSYFVNKTTMILPKSSLKLISSTFINIIMNNSRFLFNINYFQFQLLIH